MANLQFPTLQITLNGVTSTATISNNIFNIGRGSGNNLILASASVSQLQAKIYTIDGSNYFIHTYAPFYKMILNGSTVISDVQLRNNDTIVIGNAKIIFIFAEINQKVPNISSPAIGNFPIISSDGSIANSSVSPNNYYTKSEVDAKIAAIPASASSGYSRHYNQKYLTNQNGTETSGYSGISGYSGVAAGGSTSFNALTYGSTVATNAALGNNFEITITSSSTFTLSNPTGALDGQIIRWRIIQPSGSGGIIDLDTNFNCGSDLPSSSIVLSTVGSKADYLSVIYRSSTGKFDVTGFIRGF